MLFFNAHAPNSNAKKIGNVVENRALDSETNLVTIKLETLREVPNLDDYYLLAFRGIRRLGNKYHRLQVKTLPDENNLLSFIVPKTGDFKNTLEAIKPGTIVKIKGPFSDSAKRVS